MASARNALDWAASMSRKPWHAGNHCNITFDEFVRREWSPGRWGARGLFGARRPPFCPKYEGAGGRLPMLYESAGGAPPADVLELRTWKARRALELCQVCDACPGTTGPCTSCTGLQLPAWTDRRALELC